MKKGVFILILTVLVLPFLQFEFELFRLPSLNGAFRTTASPEFEWKTWVSGDFQRNFQQYTEDSVGFRPYWIRMFNQAEFSLFSLAHADRVVVGLNNELYASEYIIGYLGLNAPNKPFIDEKIRMLKWVQDYMWNTKRKLVVVVIPPDKCSIYPEMVHPRYMSQPRRFPTAKDYFVLKALHAGVNVIDFNPFFRNLKDKAKYRLIPSSGVHWSDYGSYLAADSAMKYISRLMGRPFPKLVLDSIQVTTKARNLDDDINKAMNLIWDAPHCPYAYPCFHVEYDSSFPKPAALFVADSFIWGWWHQPVIRNIFRNQEIWYYDTEVYPESFTHGKYTWEISLREALERQDLIVLLQVGAGSGNPGNNFIDRVYAEYNNSPGNRILEFERQILADSAQMKYMRNKAQAEKKPLAEVIRNFSIVRFNIELRKKK